MFGHRVDAGGCDAINADLVWIRIPVSFAATTPSPNAPAVLVASPSIGLDNGQSVDVQATGFTAGSELIMTLCPSDPLTAYGDAYDPARFANGCPFAMAGPGADQSVIPPDRVGETTDSLKLSLPLVDGGPANHAAALAELTATLPGGGVHTLFNTCWHRSQTGSNELLGRAGATIIAHENARLWLTTDVTWPWDGSHFAPLPEVARPNKTYYSKAAIDTGGRRIEYGHVRASPHTDGDTYVFFRDANVLAVGQAAAGTGWPSIDWRTGGWLGGVVGAMELLLVLADDDTQIVPARGPVLTRADIAEQHEMYDTLYERFVNLLYDGLSPAEALAARPTAEFDAKFGPSDEFVTRAFQSLWGYLTPDV